MTLAPIRGAPPGAPIPDFPIDKPRLQPPEPTAKSASDDQPSISPVRQRHMPIEIPGGGIVLTFSVIPEQPAIARASLTVQIAAETLGPSSSHERGFLRMSAGNARAFLADMRSGRSPIIATGDENGTVQIEFAIAEAATVVLVREPGQRHPLRRCTIDRSVDWTTTADELLADLGA